MTELRNLIQKYMDNQLSDEGVSELKHLLDKTEEEELQDTIEILWENYVPEKRNNYAYKKIYRNINEIIRPENKRVFGYWWQTAACIVFIALSVSTYYFYNNYKILENSISGEYQVFVDKGKNATIMLPDGSKVHLNAYSSFSYPASFSINNRDVTLSGEAYFEVQHNPDNPFTVYTSTAKVVAHGTSFNIYTYEDKNFFEATLSDGQIEIELNSKKHSSVFLEPMHKFIYNKQNGDFAVKETDLRIETAWRRGDIIVRAQSFKELIEQIEIFYGVRVFIEGNYPDKLFTGNFHEEDVTQILLNLQQHYRFKFRKVGDDIYLNFNY